MKNRLKIVLRWAKTGLDNFFSLLRRSGGPLGADFLHKKRFKLAGVWVLVGQILSDVLLNIKQRQRVMRWRRAGGPDMKPILEPIMSPLRAGADPLAGLTLVVPAVGRGYG